METIRDISTRRDSGKGKFFSPTRNFNEEKRIELRFADGDRISLPYFCLVDVIYRRADADFPGEEVVGLDFPGYWRVMVSGNNLLALFDGIHRHDVSWVRERDTNEHRADKEPFISGIHALKVNDPVAAQQSEAADKST